MPESLAETVPPDTEQPPPPCIHCGAYCPPGTPVVDDRSFCCNGCRIVYELLQQSGLGRFYDLEHTPGIRMQSAPREEEFRYLDEEPVRGRLLDFTDGKTSRVTFHIAAMHCIACVWLLENLFRLKPGIGSSQVNFPRRELTLNYTERQTSLSGVVALLASLGYQPTLSLTGLEESRHDPTARRLYLRLGVAGFAFGNIMLMSLPTYFGMDAFSGPQFTTFFAYLSLALALPVLFYSASDYWRAASLCLRKRMVTIDLPIALGITALFLQSLYDVVAKGGIGYLDSFAGLVFLLLCGKVFQRQTYERLSFDRDYRSYFPLSIARLDGHSETVVPIMDLRVGDRIAVRNQQLIPADSMLISGTAFIDYSFVTGESDPVSVAPDERIYAGGRQVGERIELETVKEVSQSHLTSLWNSEAFRKQDQTATDNVTNVVSRYFTTAILLIAAATGVYWWVVDASVAVRALTSVLIVACPCALALSAPFSLGSAMRILGRYRVYLRDASVVETLAKTGSIIFDKTGTLTDTSSHDFDYDGRELTEKETAWVRALARQSVHPQSRRLAAALGSTDSTPPVEQFREVPGQGIEGQCEGHMVRVGSSQFALGEPGDVNRGVAVAIDGQRTGTFRFANTYRPGVERLVRELGPLYELAVLSGDHDGEATRLRDLLGDDATLRFDQSPHDKLAFVRDWQHTGRRTLMLGDGLNDAGALKQSDVGIAITEDVTAFSPACDVIMDARALARLSRLMAFARSVLKVILLSFLLSLLYNILGISLAAQGMLSPLVAAVLMPASSISVVVFAVVATEWLGRRLRGDQDRGEKVHQGGRVSILFVLMIASLLLALSFLAGFAWAVRSGQFDDRHTPAMRVVTDSDEQGKDAVDKEGAPKDEC